MSTFTIQGIALPKHGITNLTKNQTLAIKQMHSKMDQINTITDQKWKS